MGDMETKKRETMIEFKAGDKVRVGSRVGKVLMVIQGRHAGTLLVDIPKHNQTWGHYKPSELTGISRGRLRWSLVEIAREKN
jgi:ribosomal protein L14E/L6E/L27E